MSNKQRKPRRNSMRYEGFDYTSMGSYWVTICTHRGRCLFGRIPNQEMVYTEIGRIAEECWLAIPDHFPHVELDEHIIMPNHVHGSLWIVADPKHNEDTEASEDADNIHSDVRRGMTCHAPTNVRPSTSPTQQPPLPGNIRDFAQSAFNNARNAPVVREFGKPIPGSLSTIIGSYKSAVSREVNKLGIMPESMQWHRNFWDRIVRKDYELERYRSYMRANPARWLQDRLHPDAPLNKFNREWREDEDEEGAS